MNGCLLSAVIVIAWPFWCINVSIQRMGPWLLDLYHCSWRTNLMGEMCNDLISGRVITSQFGFAVWCKRVAHFLTPLKCLYDYYDWPVTSQKPHKKHKSPSKHHHHGVGDAHPSSGVYLTNTWRLRGGWPCTCSFWCHRRSNLMDSIN